jgi:hypothetical protein
LYREFKVTQINGYNMCGRMDKKLHFTVKCQPCAKRSQGQLHQKTSWLLIGPEQVTRSIILLAMWWWIFSLVKKYPYFTKFRYSSKYLKQPVTGPYPEPDDSSKYISIIFLMSILILSSFNAQVCSVPFSSSHENTFLPHIYIYIYIYI